MGWGIRHIAAGCLAAGALLWIVPGRAAVVAAPTGASPAGVELPNGRLVTPAGSPDDARRRPGASHGCAVHNGALSLAATVPVPSLAGKVPGFPVIGTAAGYPRAAKVAHTARGLRLVVADEFDSTIELFDVDHGKTPRLVAQG